MKFKNVKPTKEVTNLFSRRIVCVAFSLCVLFFNPNTIYAEESQDFQDEVNADVVEDAEQSAVEVGEIVQQESIIEEESEDVVDVESQPRVEASYQDEQVEPTPQAQPFIDLSNNPASYSGKKSISIERSSKQQVSSKQKNIAPERFSDKPCDPVVNIKVDQEKRFDVLSKLAEEHSFDISMLETENVPISIEKNQPLSEVVESITRKMNVVLNYQTVGYCKRLVSITVLNNEEWGGAGSGVNSYSEGKVKGSAENRELKYISPVFTKLENVEKTQEQIEAEEQRKEEYRNSVESSGGEILNDTLINGTKLRNTYSVKGDGWKVQKEDISDMETYVQEVMNGDRVPNIRGMTPDDRKEYMRLRREYNAQQANSTE